VDAYPRKKDGKRIARGSECSGHRGVLG